MKILSNNVILSRFTASVLFILGCLFESIDLNIDYICFNKLVSIIKMFNMRLTLAKTFKKDNKVNYEVMVK